jgi:hypothetical protein
LFHGKQKEIEADDERHEVLPVLSHANALLTLRPQTSDLKYPARCGASPRTCISSTVQYQACLPWHGLTLFESQQPSSTNAYSIAFDCSQMPTLSPACCCPRTAVIGKHAPSAPFPMGWPLPFLVSSCSNSPLKIREVGTCKSTAARGPICGASQSDGAQEGTPTKLNKLNTTSTSSTVLLTIFTQHHSRLVPPTRSRTDTNQLVSTANLLISCASCKAQQSTHPHTSANIAIERT